MKAVIYKSTGSFYDAVDEHGKKWVARIRGKFKIDKRISSTNPISVGDVVEMSVEDEDKALAMITEIVTRRNYIVRSSPHNRHKQHIVGSNLDQALLIVTISSPKTSFGFIDRFLITAEAYRVPAIIVFNKSDLLEGEDKEEWMFKKFVYEQIGYKTLTISAVSEDSLKELENELKDKITLISGHSGVGKSTLINHLVPDLLIRVQEVSDWNGKGQHTTTYSEMHVMPNGGRIIDTPGVKEFGVVGFDKYDLAQFFPEMRAKMSGCRFNNCLHINEPDCKVKEALGTDISYERYESYLAILETI